MMYHEFLQMAGLSETEVSSEEFDRINTVYMAYERFPNKQDIADFYRNHGERGIAALLEPVERHNSLLRQKEAIEREIEEVRRQFEQQMAGLRAQAANLRNDLDALRLQCGLVS